MDREEAVADEEVPIDVIVFAVHVFISATGDAD